MPDLPEARPPLDFNAVYLDTNVLVRSQWPSPSVKLNNALSLASWWNVQVFLPKPVLMEAEEHWTRTVQKNLSRLHGAADQLERIARPIDVRTKIDHVPIERMVKNYRAAVEAAMAEYRIHVCPFTNVSAQGMFNLAVRYADPFELDQEGKGFQDAVILSSVLQHLKANPELKGIFVTADDGFLTAAVADYEAGISVERFRVHDLDRIYSLLWEPYWDETVTKPYAIERENARLAAKAAIPMLKEFIAAHLSESMLNVEAFSKALKLLAVGEVKVMYVQTPLPKPEQPDRHIRLAIGVSAECTAVVEKDYSYVHTFLKAQGEPPKPVEAEEKISWLGGVEVTADVVGRKLENLTPISLLTVDDLGSDKWWR